MPFSGQSKMLRLGNVIRLTPRDIDRLTTITGFRPGGIKRVDDLDAYVRKCKQYFWGVSEDTKLMHYLIDKTIESCANGPVSIQADFAPLSASSCLPGP